ncbi:uncharacterized protein BXZ73DRAFT_76030 [Epithele typhae]|uniref:uncharacterized protein n=1 Tax=Epithele typhae TaxID=378194 RepID=UPI002008CDF8|nr:uncharacterized protein BXZ73DRAFT_76030 [Epithele typhae]KAH9939316.1 hypothetical protein BXZ73DRAFT_76030 [Epithele typhae]
MRWQRLAWESQPRLIERTLPARCAAVSSTSTPILVLATLRAKGESILEGPLAVSKGVGVDAIARELPRRCSVLVKSVQLDVFIDDRGHGAALVPRCPASPIFPSPPSPPLTPAQASRTSTAHPFHLARVALASPVSSALRMYDMWNQGLWPNIHVHARADASRHSRESIGSCRSAPPRSSRPLLALCLGDVPAQAGRSRPGLQGLKLLLTTADRNMSISHNYGTLIEDEGIALRGLFIIDPKSILRCVHSAGSSTKNVSASTKKTSGSSKFVWPPVPADRAKLSPRDQCAVLWYKTHHGIHEEFDAFYKLVKHPQRTRWRDSALCNQIVLQPERRSE